MPELTPEQRLVKALTDMRFDDALHFYDTPTPDDPIALSPYHIEYLKLAQGMRQYRLYHQNELVGIADIPDTRDSRGIEWIRLQLAKYLIPLGLGEMRTDIVPMGTITPIDSPTARLTRLPIERTIPKDFKTAPNTRSDFW